MKFSAISLFVVISVLAMTQSVYGNQEIIPNATDQLNQAEVLLTEPATINTKWNNVIEQTNTLKQTAASLSVVQERECQKIDPIAFINNPEAILKQCHKQINNQNVQGSDPVEYLKVPRLDSGISVTVTKF